MKNRAVNIKTIAFLLLFSGSSSIASERGILDFLFNAADYAYRVKYDEYVAGTNYLLSSIINETGSFSRRLSPLHATQCADMHYLLLSIKHEWPTWIANYEYTYGYSLSTIMNLHTTLNNTWSAIYYVYPSSWLLYDRELESILDYLENILYEIRRPVPYSNSLEYVEICFNSISYILTGMR